MREKLVFVATLVAGLVLGFSVAMVSKQKEQTAVAATEVLPPVIVIPEKKVTTDPISALDGHSRIVSQRLNKLAGQTALYMAQANGNRTNNAQLYHTILQPHTTEHGVMRENVAYAGDGKWETAFNLFRNSPDHDFNIKNGGKYMGYATEKGVGGLTFFVVIYAEKP